MTTPRRRSGARLLAALGIVAAMLVVTPAPAHAAACTKGTGVTVVVNGDVRCHGGGGTARGSFTGVGHSLEDVRSQPGFVCRINGYPSTADEACGRTPPTNAYWGLFWSDGTSGTWNYSSQGAGSLRVPTGGWVAFVFQNSGSRTYPSMTPIGPAPAPKPTTPKPQPTSQPTAKATPSASPTPGAAPDSTASPGATDDPASPDGEQASDSPATQPETADDATSAAASSDGGSSPWPAAVVTIALILLLAAGAWWAARRRPDSS